MKRLVIIHLFLLLACEEPISLTIKKETDLLVINGLITDQPGPYIITITKNAKFGTQDKSANEEGATVTIHSNIGEVDSLKENRTRSLSKLQ